MRSILFVPGTTPERFVKASESGADIYCIDLEDGVPAAQKKAARHAALEHLRSAGPTCYLRINGLATLAGLEDLLALAALDNADALPACIVLPMAASAFELRQIISVLPTSDTLKIMPMIETPEGLDNLPAILEAGLGRIEALAFGCADYAAAIGSDMGWDALLSARSAMVKAASKHGVQCIDGPCFDIADLDTLKADCAGVSRLGFSGKLAIHPGQVETINRVFAPSPEQLTWARDVINAFAQAGGGVLSHDGMMIDQPVIDQARRILASENP